MPMPKPKAGESKPDFIKRVMGDPMMNDEYPDEKQRRAIAESQWNDKSNYKIETTEIRNVEILSTGVWNGVNFTKNDLSEIISNFENKVLEPFINLDHNDKFTDKVKENLKVLSLGFVSSLRQMGDKLVADFKQVPKKVAELIEAGLLKKRSIEIFHKGFNVNGKKYNNVLRAVSFFGADVPAVNNLSDDFEVMLQSHYMTTKAEENLLILDKYHKKENTMEITDKEYQELLSFKQKSITSDVELSSYKTKVANLEKDKNDLTDKVTSLEKEKNDNAQKVKDLEKFKEDAEKEAQKKLGEEAEKFVTDAIKEGKILPASKEMYIEDYKEKSKDEKKLKLFKDDISSRGKIINLGEFKDESGKINLNKIDPKNEEQIEEAIKHLMDKENMSWEKAAEKVGYLEPGELEVK